MIIFFSTLLFQIRVHIFSLIEKKKIKNFYIWPPKIRNYVTNEKIIILFGYIHVTVR